jgi:hypothetical protein
MAYRVELYCDSVAGVVQPATSDSIALQTMNFEGVIYVPKTQQDWSLLTSLQAIMAGE